MWWCGQTVELGLYPTREQAVQVAALARIVLFGEDRHDVARTWPTFGQRIEVWRLARRLTVAALTQASGLPWGVVGILEADQREPTLAEAWALADALELTIDRLAGRDC